MLKDFCALDESEISELFRARSHPSIYAFLGDFAERKSDIKAFKNFINYLKSQSDKKYFALYENADFIGVVCFFDITNTTAQIGFYKNPALYKVGKILIKNLLDKAHDFGLSSLFARVKNDNEKSLNLLKSFGFLEMEILDNKIILAKNL